MGRPKKNLEGNMETLDLAKTMFQEVQVDDTILAQSTNIAEKMPSPADPEWPKFLLSQLTEDEKDKNNGYPKASGLRRLVLKYVGRIVESFPNTVCFPSAENNFTAIVEHRFILSSQLYDDSLKFGGVGEANRTNSDKPYDKYLVSVASSRAISRALKEALNVNFVTSEEVSAKADEDVDDEDSDLPITSAQKSGIIMICKKYNIDPNKFVNLDKFKYDNGIEDNTISKSTARKMMSKLNEYQKDSTLVPQEIKV
jgi:hypothetical protein